MRISLINADENSLQTVIYSGCTRIISSRPKGTELMDKNMNSVSPKSEKITVYVKQNSLTRKWTKNETKTIATENETKNKTINPEMNV